MLAVYAFGAPLIGWLATENALGHLRVGCGCRCAQARGGLRDIHNVAYWPAQWAAVASPCGGDVDVSVRPAERALDRVRSRNRSWLGRPGIHVIQRIGREFRARNYFERFVLVVLLACAGVAVLTTLGIVLSVLFETYRFFFDPSSRVAPPSRIPVRHRVEPAGGDARGPG